MPLTVRRVLSFTHPAGRQPTRSTTFRIYFGRTKSISLSQKLKMQHEERGCTPSPSGMTEVLPPIQWRVGLSCQLAAPGRKSGHCAPRARTARLRGQRHRKGHSQVACSRAGVGVQPRASGVEIEFGPACIDEAMHVLGVAVTSLIGGPGSSIGSAPRSGIPDLRGTPARGVYVADT